MEKEDWYIAFRLACKTFKEPKQEALNLQKIQLADANFLFSDVSTKSPVVDTSKIKPLPAINDGDQSTQWFNAIVGRVFSAISHSDKFKDFIERILGENLEKLQISPNIVNLFRFDIVNLIRVNYHWIILILEPTLPCFIMQSYFVSQLMGTSKFALILFFAALFWSTLARNSPWKQVWQQLISLPKLR